jgi:hypothetical protein
VSARTLIENLPINLATAAVASGRNTEYTPAVRTADGRIHVGYSHHVVSSQLDPVKRMNSQRGYVTPDGEFHGLMSVARRELAKKKVQESGPTLKTLKAHKVALTDEERDEAMKAGAVWHFNGPDKPCCAIWKAVVRGKTYYGSNTHRCFQAHSTLKAAIRSYHDVVEPSG